jgi:hypothetical protein
MSDNSSSCELPVLAESMPFISATPVYTSHLPVLTEAIARRWRKVAQLAMRRDVAVSGSPEILGPAKIGKFGLHICDLPPMKWTGC